MKKTIAVDVDDVLVPHETHLAEQFRQYFDVHYPHDHLHGLSALLPEEQKPQVKEIMNRFLTSEEFRSVEPVEGATSAMRQLDKCYRLVVITSRPKIVHDITKEWLNWHFPNVFNDIHFVNASYGWGELRGVSKREVCQQANAQYLVDDSLLHIQEAAEYGVNGLLFGDYPWNQAEELPAGTVRVKGWEEVARVLL